MPLSIEEAVNLAIRNISFEGLTDIFPKPFEIDLIDKPEILEAVTSQLKRFSRNDFVNLGVSPIDYILIPKSKIAYNYRRAAIIQPMCSITFLSLSIIAASYFEPLRIPLSENTVFSHRFAPSNGQIFSEEGGFNKWKEEIVKRRDEEKCKVVVKCDISSFYDRVNLHRIESTLQAISVPSWVSTSLNKILSYWSHNDSFGLPVGGNASRMLAEIALYDVDNALREKGVNFVRFIDDYRLFAPNPMTAQKWLSFLISRLSIEGLFLNAAKTNFYPAEKLCEDGCAAFIIM